MKKPDKSPVLMGLAVVGEAGKQINDTYINLKQ